MNKYLLSLLFAFITLTIKAQTNTYYYKLSKEILGGKVNTEVTGGQFITITEHYCFDSDINGNGIGNGTLYFDSKSSNTLRIFVGNSYYGNVRYKFNSDYSLLNIEISSSLIYVYKRSEPPTGIVTSSLIKKKENESFMSESKDLPYTPPTQGYIPRMGEGNISSHQEKSVQKNIIREACRRCNGRKRIVHNTYPSMFGLDDYKVRCNECGEYHLRSTGHTHITCPDCKGKGYKERTTYSYE